MPSHQNINPSPYARWHMLPLNSIELTGGFWANRQQMNHEVTLPHGYYMLEKAGNFENLRLAGGSSKGHYRGREFADSDIYKWLEAAAYELQHHFDESLKKKVDQVIELIVAAQQEDGYLNSYFQVVKQGESWTDLDFGHELYCAGHLFQAAVAHFWATGDPRLLEVSTRFADHISSIFGPGKRPGAPGHPEIEMALVELYRTTGNQAYLDLAKFFIDQRGQSKMRGLGWVGSEYHQDRVPVREASEIEGHAVRALYLTTGVTMLYQDTGERALLEALTRQWQDMVGRKLYLTGGLGARYEGESFGKPYELPPDQCYCETCAAIASILWNWQMLQVTGHGRFADLMERTLYNGFLSGLSADGRHFFYMNPLMSRGGNGRQEWYETACCPPNIMRLLASLGQYFATRDPTGLQIHLYDTGTIQTTLPSGDDIALAMMSDYPWQGKVELTVQTSEHTAWTLRLRVPGWCTSAQVNINGQPLDNTIIEDGYLVLKRVWKPGDVVALALAIAPQLIEAHPRIDAVRNSVAIEHGPLIYCLEAVDSTANLMDIYLDAEAPLQADWRDDILPEKIMVIKTRGYARKADNWQEVLYRPVRKHHHAANNYQPVWLTAVPYYAWANREPGMMRVWIPRFDKA